MSQTIFRNASRRKPHSVILNAAIQDDTLTPEAGWVLVLMLSLPEDWRTNLNWVASKRRMGRDRTKAAVAELTSRRYCKRTRRRKATGSFGGYEYLFSDEPGVFSPAPEDQAAVQKCTVDWKPVTGEPATVVQATYKDINLQNQKYKEKKDARTNLVDGTDKLPISMQTARNLEGIGVDPVALVAKFRKCTRGKVIEDPDAYCWAMGKKEAAKREGVSPAALQSTVSRNHGERKKAYADAAPPTPSSIAVAIVRRNAGAQADALITAWMKSATGRRIADVDKSFLGFCDMARFSGTMHKKD